MRYAVSLLGSLLFAQQPAPIGIVLGKVTAVSPSGIIDFRSVSGTLYRCSFDDSTFAEKERNRIAPQTLAAGETVEITTDRKLGRCYARTITVMNIPAEAVNPGHRIDLRTTRSRVVEQLFPRGNLTYAGVVLRHSTQTLVVRTRSDGEKILLLRDDTRFLDSGARGELANLTPNTRVFVRAGRNLDNELEVYQVIWGAIDGPSPGTP